MKTHTLLSHFVKMGHFKQINAKEKKIKIELILRALKGFRPFPYRRKDIFFPQH